MMGNETFSGVSTIGQQDKLLTPKEVVNQLFQQKISYRRLLEFAKSGQINCMRTGHTYLFSKAEVEKWLQKNLTSPAWVKSKV